MCLRACQSFPCSPCWDGGSLFLCCKAAYTLGILAYSCGCDKITLNKSTTKNKPATTQGSLGVQVTDHYCGKGKAGTPNSYLQTQPRWVESREKWMRACRSLSLAGVQLDFFTPTSPGSLAYGATHSGQDNPPRHVHRPTCYRQFLTETLACSKLTTEVDHHTWEGVVIHRSVYKIPPCCRVCLSWAHILELYTFAFCLLDQRLLVTFCYSFLCLKQSFACLFFKIWFICVVLVVLVFIL